MESICSRNVGNKGDNDDTVNTVSSSINEENFETEGTGTVSKVVRAVTLMYHIRTELMI